MPFIKIEAIKAKKKQKQNLIEELKRTAAQILRTKQDASLFESKNSTDDWGMGGKVLTNVLK